MLKYAEKISKDFVVVRVDFYDTPNRIYLGELKHLHRVMVLTRRNSMII